MAGPAGHGNELSHGEQAKEEVDPTQHHERLCRAESDPSGRRGGRWRDGGETQERAREPRAERDEDWVGEEVCTVDAERHERRKHGIGGLEERAQDEQSRHRDGKATKERPQARYA
jgi:hypothetical protein